MTSDTLSSKIYADGTRLLVEDVKEFIAALKEKIEQAVRYKSIENCAFVTESAALHIVDMKIIIDELAGLELTGENK